MSIIEIIKQLSSGMGITIEIFFVTLVTSLILGQMCIRDRCGL